ncbi:MAG: hypothetical protein EXS31_10140 [Pedosphaera sp.]|nr:hypothetical protein [Pedosphaera sp.]
MKRSIAFAAVAVLTAFLIALSVVMTNVRKEPNQINVEKVVAAVRTYETVLKSEGRPVPDMVPLAELLTRSLIDPKDVSAFDGMEVTVNLHPDESRPQAILMKARLPVGTEIAAMGDGSVQQRPR